MVHREASEGPRPKGMTIVTFPAFFLPLYVPEVEMKSPASGRPEMFMGIDPKQPLKAACSPQPREAQDNSTAGCTSQTLSELLLSSGKLSLLVWVHQCVPTLLCHWMVQRRENTRLRPSSPSRSKEFPLPPITGGQGSREPGLPHIQAYGGQLLINPTENN